MLLDSGLKLSNIIVILCSKLLDYILLKSGNISGLYFTLERYASLYDKIRPDLESTHQASCFGIWFIQIGQIEVDINQLNISGLKCV